MIKTWEMRRPGLYELVDPTGAVLGEVRRVAHKSWRASRVRPTDRAVIPVGELAPSWQSAMEALERIVV